MGAVAAGVSVISGIAGIASKNQQARAQQDSINASAKQVAVQQAATEVQLQAQQAQVQQEYQLGILARMQAYDQAQAGLAAQQNLAALKAQSETYQAQYAGLQALGQGTQQLQQMDRQASNIQTATDARIGGTAAKEGAYNEQLLNKLEAELSQQTAEQRKQISAQAAGRMASYSSDTSRSKSQREMVAEAFSRGLGVDNAQLLAELQGVSEDSLALIAQQIGLTDTNANIDAISTNIRLAAEGTKSNMQQTAADYTNTANSLQIARDTNDYSAAAQDKSARDAYRATDTSLGLQRDTVAKGGAAQQAGFAAQSSAVRGAGFADYLNFGVNTYGAVSPLLQNSKPIAQVPVAKPITNYSGNPSYFNNAA